MKEGYCAAECLYCLTQVQVLVSQLKRMNFWWCIALKDSFAWLCNVHAAKHLAMRVCMSVCVPSTQWKTEHMAHPAVAGLCFDCKSFRWAFTPEQTEINKLSFCPAYLILCFVHSTTKTPLQVFLSCLVSVTHIPQQPSFLCVSTGHCSHMMDSPTSSNWLIQEVRWLDFCLLCLENIVTFP